MAFNTSGGSGIPLSVLGGLVTEINPTALPEGCSPDNQEMMYLPGSAYSRPAFAKIGTAFPAGGPSGFIPTLVNGHSFVDPEGDIHNLYFDSNGVLWVEDPINALGTYTLLLQSTPGSYAKFLTAFGRCFIAISDGLHGTDIPWQYDGVNLDRVTIEAPGSSAAVTSVALPAVSLTSGGTTLSRNNNIVTAVTAAPHNLKVGYQAQISNVPDSNSTSVVQNNNSSAQTVGGSWSLVSGQYRSTFNPGTSPLSDFVATNFGFNVPSNATILGVVVSFASYLQNAATGSTVAAVALWRSGAQLGTSKAPGTTLTTTPTTNSYGGAGDLWGAGLTPAIVNDPTFGFALSETLTTQRSFINFPFTVQVYYTLSGTGTVSQISSIVIDNESIAGEALVTTTTAHGLIPGIYVSIVGVQPGTVANVSAAQWSSGITTLITATSHNLNPGAVIQVGTVSTSTGSTTFSFNGTFTVQSVPSPNQLVYAQSPITATDPDVINATASTGSVTVAWPIPINTPTPTYFEVLSCPTATTFYIQISYSDATWTTGTVGFIWQGIFYVTKILSAISFQYQQYGPNGATSAIGTVTPYGQCAPGLHLMQVLYLDRQGQISAPSPPVQFIANGGQYVQVSNIPVPVTPTGIVARILAFTGAQPNVPGILPPFFYLAVPAQLEGQVISTATQINDITTTSALLDFSDNSLFGAAAESGAISVPGNNLANQIVLDGALSFAYSESRLKTIGQRATVQNLLNMNFDGGFQPSTPNSSFNPAPWTQTGTAGQLQAVGTTFGAGRYGGCWSVTCPPSSTLNGLISQPAYLDAYGNPILDGNITYGFRLFVASTLAPGISIVITFFSPSVGVLATCSVVSNPNIQLGSGFLGGWDQGMFNAPTPSAIPPDTVIQVSVSNANSSAATVCLDEMSLYDAENPYLDNQSFTSYTNNPGGMDGVSGVDGPTDDTHKVMDFVIIRQTMYAITQDPSGRVHEIIVNPTSEPSGWKWKEIQANCGTLSAFSVTHSQADDESGAAGDDWSTWAMEGGAGLFDGGQVHKISQEIQPNWFDPYSLYPWVPAGSAINMAAAHTISSLNDPVERMIYFFVPTHSATAPDQVYPLSYRELNSSYAIVNSPPIHVSLGGRLIVTDNTRKWTHWLRAMNGAARMYRSANQLTTVFFGGNGQSLGAVAGYGNAYVLTPGKLTDDDFGQIYPYYVTFYGPDPEKSAGLGLPMTRLQYEYVLSMISGTGVVTYSVFCDSPSNQWRLTAVRNLTISPKFPQEFAGCQALGYRMALKIASSPASNLTTDNAFNIFWLRNWYKKAKLQIRGAAQ